MEVRYKVILDANKSGVQKILTGFQTADKRTRIVEISVTSSGKPVDLEGTSVLMYIQKRHSEIIVREANIVGNMITYKFASGDYDKPGNTVIQAKIIKSDENGTAEQVLIAPEFAIEVEESLSSDSEDEVVASDEKFSVLEQAIAKVETAYKRSVKNVTITEDYTLLVEFYDGEITETDSWKNVVEETRENARVVVAAKDAAENSKEAAAKSAKAAESSKNTAAKSATSAEDAKNGAEKSASMAKSEKEVAEAYAGQARNMAETAAAQKSQAQAAAQESVEAKEQTAKYEESARSAAKAAADSKEGAVASANEANAAKEEAGQEFQKAEKSAEAAFRSAQSAENSASVAKRHAESAETAQAESEKSRDSAKTYAEYSASSADNAKTSADRSEAAADRADNAADRAAASAKEASLEERIRMNYAVQRTGKVYQTKLYKFEANPTSTGEKLLDNAGLEWEPSTDTVVGVDDYANIPLFRWQNVNYVRDEDGSPRPIAIEGDANYKTSGSVDVGVMQMSFYWKWDTSDPEYDLITISDSPHEELGLVPWSECIRADGSVMPWCIGSKYFSGIAADGFLRSQPGLPLAVKQSYNNIQDNYAKKGAGYHGAGNERNTFQIIFIFIKGATKNSQSKLCGCTNYSYQYKASIQRSEKDIYFPVTNAQAANIEIGSRVYVGYGAMSGSSMTTDRGYDSMKKYADMAKVLRIEELDDSNKAIYLDVAEGFDTTPVQIADGVLSDIYISTMGWAAGDTDTVIGHHDGSAKSNLSGWHPYRVQGREYAVGSYFVSSDTVICFNEDLSKTVYVAEKGIARSKTDSIIKATYRNAGMIPALNSGEDFWIGDIDIDMQTGVSFPSKVGSSNSQGMADKYYAGGSAAAGTIREYLTAGVLWDGSHAGVAFLSCRAGLGRA
ncbi:MAG: BppU family phage baseplate upper protein, partial [Lachnospiraceae bacterium]|nr:BppU family phage baseplate upper protein [Lachnospiraceae bacterium]